MFFITPADVKGTSFMNWSYNSGQDDDQWIYLPALKRTKRISSGSKSDYFMGSDFTYDDLVWSFTLPRGRFMPPNYVRSAWISDISSWVQGLQDGVSTGFFAPSRLRAVISGGDFIDFWSLHKGGRWPSGHGRVLNAVLALAERGVRVVYIPGNHDEVVRDYLALRVGGIEIMAE